MNVKDLITDETLRLELATPSPQSDLDRPITAVVTTESIAPAAYLQSGTLLLTTGMALNFHDGRIWDAYVERLADSEVCALAFGVGLPHASVPSGLAKAALARHLPILVVPEDVPFLQLQQNVTQVLADERYRLTRRAWQIAARCTRFASTSNDVDSLLDLLRREVTADLDIVDESGDVFMSSQPIPSRVVEPTPVDLPLPIGDEATWTLRIHADSSVDSRTLLAPATTVISMVLSRLLGTPPSAGSDRLAALFADQQAGGGELRRELSAAGFEPAEGARVLSIHSTSPLRTRLLARRIDALLHANFRSAVMLVRGRTMILAAPSPPGPHGVPTGPVPLPSDASFQGLVAADSGDGLLVSEPAGSVEHLALTVALQARRVPRPGVDYAGPPNLHDIAHLIPDTPRAALVDAVLGPVLQESNGAQRLAALKAILATNTTSAAATRLGVHRNTLHSLRARLEEQLAVNLDDAGERAVLALALAIADSPASD